MPETSVYPHAMNGGSVGGQNKMSNFQIGDPVIVVNSNHGMVSSGETGMIECRHAGGFGVAIKKVWPKISNEKTREPEVRVCWFKPKQLAELLHE